MKLNNKLLGAILFSFVALLVFVGYLAAGMFEAVRVEKPQTEVVQTTLPEQPQQMQETTTAAVLVPDSAETTTDGSIPVSAMNEQQLLDTLTQAVLKTRGYSGNLTVDHEESFEAEIIECSGGPVVVSVANTIVGMVTKPVDEILNFNGGKAVDSKDVELPILLPQYDNFTLKLDGVKSINGTMNGNNIVINVLLVEETAVLDTIPPVNASAMGYLNVNLYDTSMLTITAGKVDYIGSTMEIHIRPDGYVDYAEYVMPMHIEGAANGAGISGTAIFEGQQKEIWKFNW